MSKTQRHRLASALVSLTGLPFSEARAVISQRIVAGGTPEEIEAYLAATFRIDPTGVTAVRNVMRGGASGAA